MKSIFTISAAIALTAGLHISTVDAATVTSNLNFSKSAGLFGGSSSGAGFSSKGSSNIGIGTLYYDVGANTGTVNAYNRSKVTASYQEMMSFEDAANASIKLSVSGQNTPLLPNSGFSTSFGAGAEVGVRNLFGVLDWAFIDEGARLNASKTSSSVTATTLSGSDRDTLTGVGPDIALASLTANADVKQSSSLIFGNLFGKVQATHSSGEVRTAAFDFATSTLLGLNLQKAGLWDLDLIGVDIANTFSSRFSMVVNGEACLLGNCGSLDVAEVTFANIKPFSINFASKNVDIGGITVKAAPIPVTPVPLPGGLPLMAAGMGAFWVVRWARRTQNG